MLHRHAFQNARHGMPSTLHMPTRSQVYKPLTVGGPVWAGVLFGRYWLARKNTFSTVRRRSTGLKFWLGSSSQNSNSSVLHACAWCREGRFGHATQIQPCKAKLRAIPELLHGCLRGPCHACLP